MAEQPPAVAPPEAGVTPANSASEAATATKDETPPASAATLAPKPQAASEGNGLTFVKLPQGWEGLSIKMRGNRCFISEVPKACFSSNAKAADGTIRNQVDGVTVDDEVVSLNGEPLARVIERISTKGDSWNACSSASPPHEVGSKTKFDSPPCAVCDFIRRRKALGFDVALQMWLRAVKRDIQFTLGVRSGAAAAEEDDSLLPSLNASPDEASQPVKRMALGSLDDCKGVSTVVNLQASAESSDRMTKALEKLQKLAELDDATRHKKYKQAGKGGKGSGKGKKGKRPSGPYLERTRLTDSLVTGEVVEWKKSFGWIKPHKAVDHPKAGAHKGKLYVHKVDLEYWVTALTVGSFCRFHVYSDANSLGAEECTELKEAGSNDADENSCGEERPPGAWSKEDRSRSPRRR